MGNLTTKALYSTIVEQLISGWYQKKCYCVMNSKNNFFFHKLFSEPV